MHTPTGTQAKKNYRHPLLLGLTRLLHLTHTHTYKIRHTITQRQTHILTVALHYSEPGVGGKGNKVVFISCSLGVL